MQKAYQPKESILHQRFELSKSFSALRRVRPRVSFWSLAAHRIPTLWSLYRGLLRHAPGDDIRWRMRMYFERYRSLSSPRATREKLQQAHKFLDFFRFAAEGNEKCRQILVRYNSMIGAKRAKEEMKCMIKEELAWQYRLRHRPIMTGAFLRPSILNGPLPRLKPQPVRITMMMRNRQLAYERMGERYARLTEHLREIRMEKIFERALLEQESSSGSDSFDPAFHEVEGWDEAILQQRKEIRESFDRASQRVNTPYSPEMLAAIIEARREKIRNKTRERERERRGEILRRTIERSRRGPPAHVLAKMPEWRRRADKVIRSVSEVGYVGMMKSRLGIKMKNPNLWRELEEGKGEDSESGFEKGRSGNERNKEIEEVEK